MIMGVGGQCGGVFGGASWRLCRRGDPDRRAHDEDRKWSEVLLAATVQGAIFSGVKGAVDRTGAATIRRLTGTWPS
ncbi:DUF4235 domain-containing protein [Streptomyces sp. NPDC005236]|uniref:DUF4235 domain-containing protein n=1 Tax=Streptomyces sp. NPDC005236 TaxID=3157028 RepID=UPI0033ACC5B0